MIEELVQDREMQAILEYGGTVRRDTVEMVDLRYVLDQYSDHHEPVIQIVSTKEGHFQVNKTHKAATAGRDQVLIKMCSSYEDALREFKRLIK